MNENIKDDVFQVEEVIMDNFNEDGSKSDEPWEGFAVSKISDPANYHFECRDKLNADDLCDYLNSVKFLDSKVADDLTEWSMLITELSRKEIKLYECKENYQFLSDKVLAEAKENNIDLKKIYGGNNATTRKQYVKETLVNETKEIKDLEFSIDYITRRISFLKQLVHTKIVLMEVK